MTGPMDHARTITVSTCNSVTELSWFMPTDRLENVAVAVQWSPFDPNGQLWWVIFPFGPANRTVRRVNYPGRSHATTYEEAARLAWELFSISRCCLLLKHTECPGVFAQHEDGTDGVPCACNCHTRQPRP